MNLIDLLFNLGLIIFLFIFLFFFSFFNLNSVFKFFILDIIKGTQSERCLLRILVINKFDHHLDILRWTLVGRKFTVSINHDFRNVVKHLMIGLELFRGSWVVGKFDHHLDILRWTLVGRKFTVSINHDFRNVVKHLMIGLELFRGSWVVGIRFDYEFVTGLASLLTLCKQMKGSWIKVLKESGLTIQVTMSLLDVGNVIQVKLLLKCIIKRWESNFFNHSVLRVGTIATNWVLSLFKDLLFQLFTTLKLSLRTFGLLATSWRCLSKVDITQWRAGTLTSTRSRTILVDFEMVKQTVIRFSLNSGSNDLAAAWLGSIILTQEID